MQMCSRRGTNIMYFSQCTFGILKGRFRILKTGIRLHDYKCVDMIWKTCCALHNMLLHVDGLDKPWDGVNMPTSEYEGRFGEFDFDDMPVYMQRLYSPDEIRAYDESKIVRGVSYAASSDSVGVSGRTVIDDDHIDDIRVVRNLSLDYFRGRLVEHFDILFRQGKVIWPKSRGQQPASLN